MSELQPHIKNYPKLFYDKEFLYLTNNWILDVKKKCMPNGMECIFQCENENSKVSHHHAICVKDENVGDQWQWQLFKLDGQVEDSMPFYES